MRTRLHMHDRVGEVGWFWIWIWIWIWIWRCLKVGYAFNLRYMIDMLLGRQIHAWHSMLDWPGRWQSVLKFGPGCIWIGAICHALLWFERHKRIRGNDKSCQYVWMPITSRAIRQWPVKVYLTFGSAHRYRFQLSLPEHTYDQRMHCVSNMHGTNNNTIYTYRGQPPLIVGSTFSKYTWCRQRNIKGGDGHGSCNVDDMLDCKRQGPFDRNLESRRLDYLVSLLRCIFI